MSDNKNSIIGDWLGKNSDPSVDKFINLSLYISACIIDKMSSNDDNDKMAAEKLNVSINIFKSYISGFYNFNLKEIIKIGEYINKDIIKSK